MTQMQIYSTIICCNCGNEEKLKMPVYAMKYHYECPVCKTLHRTTEKECCIFCSYGTVKCPGSQRAAAN